MGMGREPRQSERTNGMEEAPPDEGGWLRRERSPWTSETLDVAAG
jgi:hypothetical protein